jgi:hypothetical protein
LNAIAESWDAEHGPTSVRAREFAPASITCDRDAAILASRVCSISAAIVAT